MTKAEELSGAQEGGQAKDEDLVVFGIQTVLRHYLPFYSNAKTYLAF